MAIVAGAAGRSAGMGQGGRGEGGVAQAATTQHRLIGVVMAMFFAFGFCTTLMDTLVPKFKAMFALNYAEVMLTQFCFFGAYFIVSLPAGWLLGRIGYLRTMVVGLLLMAAGAVGFAPAAAQGTYPGFLTALFVLAAGVTVVQVAANPLAAVAGPADQAPSRLTLAQAFNSVATVAAPQFGAFLILSHLAAAPAHADAAQLAAFRASQGKDFVGPFLGIAGVLLLLALVCWLVRGWSPRSQAPAAGSLFRLLARPRLAFGALCIFTYVGAEVAVGSATVNYLMQPDVLGASAVLAGHLVSVYWAGLMVGRFAGSAILRRIPAGLVLGLCACAAGVLALVSGFSTGMVAAVTLLAIGLANSIMFPTIFTLAIENLGDETSEASGVICLAIVGGAVVPLAFGLMADRVGLGHALVVPAICDVVIAAFGLLIWRGGLRAAPV